MTQNQEKLGGSVCCSRTLGSQGSGSNPQPLYQVTTTVPPKAYDASLPSCNHIPLDGKHHNCAGCCFPCTTLSPRGKRQWGLVSCASWLAPWLPRANCWRLMLQARTVCSVTSSSELLPQVRKCRLEKETFQKNAWGKTSIRKESIQSDCVIAPCLFFSSFFLILQHNLKDCLDCSSSKCFRTFNWIKSVGLNLGSSGLQFNHACLCFCHKCV